MRQLVNDFSCCSSLPVVLQQAILRLPLQPQSQQQHRIALNGTLYRQHQRYQRFLPLPLMLPALLPLLLLSPQVVSQGLTPQGALTAVVQAMEAAGGSFKALQKELRKQHQQHTKQQQQQQQQRDAASESPTSPFAWLRASPGPSPRSKMASQAALFSSPAGSAAAAVWGEGAGAGSDLSSGAGRKSSGAGRKTSAAGRKVSAASVVAAAAAAAADAVNVGDGVQRLLGEDSVGVGTSLNPVLVQFGAGAAWGLEGCGSGAASGRELLSHPVVMAECSWADCDE
jgi:hypothetical protein